MVEPVDNHISTPEADNKPAVWGGVTDSKHHREGNFRYTVYGINPSAKFAMMGEGLAMAKSGLATQEEIAKQATNLLVEPERVADRVGVSMSIIDQDHRGTWGSVGLIIEVPEENMIATSTSDLGSGGTSAEWLRNVGQRHPILDPEQILKSSNKDNYNEIVAWGTTESGSKLRLAGFFAKTVEGEYIDTENAYQLEAQSTRLGIPFVKIESPNRFDQESVEVSNQYQAVYVNYGGKRYVLPFGESGQFDVMNSKLESRFMSPPALENVLSHLQSLVNSGKYADLPQNIISTLKEKYEQADKSRKAPVFGRYGNLFNGFTMTMGYGDQEYEIRVGNHGAYRFSMALERAAIRRMLSQGDHYGLKENYSSTVIGADEVDRLLEQNLSFLEPAEAKKIQDFYNGARTAIQRNFEQEQKRYKPANFEPALSIGNRHSAKNFGGQPYMIFPKLDLSKLSDLLKDEKP